MEDSQRLESLIQVDEYRLRLTEARVRHESAEALESLENEEQHHYRRLMALDGRSSSPSPSVF